jgi:hypothetical protein
MAIPILIPIATAFAGIVSFIVKHPFVSKMMIFTIFTALIGLFVSYIQGLVSPYIVDNSFLAFAAYLGVLDALSLYLTIVLAGFGAKQLLAFVRS